MSYVRTLAICLLLVYFVGATGCHCFDYDEPHEMLIDQTENLSFTELNCIKDLEKNNH